MPHAGGEDPDGELTTRLNIARRWIERINQGDVAGLVDMMTDDHTF